ncbi:hypothetical protein V6N11_031511 [Hibiscus sabdariffa]|uniref:Uncharacterized protein n=1 Tax=Hibiscus sabdariffa TaxID=183260 RepID=A0ABR2SY59_9ROSI
MLIRNSGNTGSVSNSDSKIVFDKTVSKNVSSKAVELVNDDISTSGSPDILQQSPSVTADHSVDSSQFGSATETSSGASNIPLATTRPARQSLETIIKPFSMTVGERQWMRK